MGPVARLAEFHKDGRIGGRTGGRNPGAAHPGGGRAAPRGLRGQPAAAGKWPERAPIRRFPLVIFAIGWYNVMCLVDMVLRRHRKTNERPGGCHDERY